MRKIYDAPDMLLLKKTEILLASADSQDVPVDDNNWPTY